MHNNFMTAGLLVSSLLIIFAKAVHAGPQCEHRIPYDTWAEYSTEVDFGNLIHHRNYTCQNTADQTCKTLCAVFRVDSHDHDSVMEYYHEFDCITAAEKCLCGIEPVSPFQPIQQVCKVFLIKEEIESLPEPSCKEAPTDGAHSGLWVFTTQTKTTGAIKFLDLEGLAAADAICQNEAAQANLCEPHSFKAWLSSRNSSVQQRFSASEAGIGQERPYFTPLDNGEDPQLSHRLVAYNWDQLTSADLQSSLSHDAWGKRLYAEYPRNEATRVWSSTTINGGFTTPITRKPWDCNEWRSTTGFHESDTEELNPLDLKGSYGFSIRTSDRWSNQGHTACKTRLPLYCFQQPQIPSSE